MLNDTKRENSWLPFLCITLLPCQLFKKCRPSSACLRTRAKMSFISKPRITSLFFYDVRNPSSLFDCHDSDASEKERMKGKCGHEKNDVGKCQPLSFS